VGAPPRGATLGRERNTDGRVIPTCAGLRLPSSTIRSKFLEFRKGEVRKQGAVVPMHVHRTPLSVHRGPEGPGQSSLGRKHVTQEPASMALTPILPQAPEPPKRRAAPRTCARESVAFGYYLDPSGVDLSARPSTRTGTPSPSTSRLLAASNPRAGCRPASPPSPSSASYGL
jgi:hypothetical protein